MPLEEMCNVGSMHDICHTDYQRHELMKLHAGDSGHDKANTADMCLTGGRVQLLTHAAAEELAKVPDELNGTQQLAQHVFAADAMLDAAAAMQIKSEHNATPSALDLFPTHPTTWQQHPMNSQEHAHLRLDLNTTSKLLLQGSDDPLICCGADDVHDEDHPLEFKTVIAKKQLSHQQQQLQQAQQQHRLSYQPDLCLTLHKGQSLSGCSSLTKQQLKAKASQMSAQSRQQQQQRQQQQHQQQQQQAQLVSSQSKKTPPVSSNSNNATTSLDASAQRMSKTKKKGALKLRFHHQALPPVYLSHYEATHGQHQQPARVQPNSHSAKASAKRPPAKNAQENVRSWLQKIAEIQRAATHSKHQQQQQQQQQHQPQQQQHLQSDINNNNYNINQTTFEGGTNRLSKSQLDHQKTLYQRIPATTTSKSLDAGKGEPQLVNSSNSRQFLKYSDLPYMGEITLYNSKPRRGRKPKKADICHLIYKNYGTIVPGTPASSGQPIVAPVTAAATVGISDAAQLTLQPAPTRHDEPLNLCLRDQSNDRFSISSDDSSDKVTTPTSECTSFETHSLPAPDIPQTIFEDATMLVKSESHSATATPTSNDAASSLLQHSVSLYYQQLLESGLLTSAHGQDVRIPIETIEKDNQLSLKIPIPSGLFPITAKVEPPTPSPTSDNTLPVSLPSDSRVTSPTCSLSNLHIQLVPPKRKRSAIFIPPMPAENCTNPPTEVSICKFKFTGGAKPTLQEKKMLSVDAEGNYRFYNGTSEKEKTLQGYELLNDGSPLCRVADVTDKLYVDIPPPSADLSHELLQISPESPTSVLLQQPPPHIGLHAHSPVTHYPSANSPKLAKEAPLHVCTLTNQAKAQTSDRKRPKLRRSTQREKFEKSFSEKGFLIQTQQLQSAEGATYCKFRQLKKFTRYLFRNWKDYLPNGELSGQPQPIGERQAAIEHMLANQLALSNATPKAEPTAGGYSQNDS